MTITIQEYYTQKPSAIEFIQALEIHHAEYGTLRFVNQPVARMLGIEAGAPRNAGQTVQFDPLFFRIAAPRQNDTGSINIGIDLGRVGSNVKDALKQVRGFARQRPHEIIYREYFGDDLTEPSRLWQVFGSEVSLSVDGVSINGTEDNPTTRDWSRTYIVSDFPGLSIV